MKGDYMKPQSFFYAAEPIYKTVSHEEFKKFIKEYPRKLEGDCCGIFDPPLVTYNDFELANRWPYSVVAQYHAGEPCEYYGWDFKPEYRIVVNHEDLYASKTGNQAESGE
jgi:hypothetical protein